MFPDFLPAAVTHLTESTSIALAQQIQRHPVSTPLCPEPIPTTLVCTDGPGDGPGDVPGNSPGDVPENGPKDMPIVLLHGFDSSLLEFRRLVPHLAPHAPTWAIDLLGFGFSDRTLSPRFDPVAIKTHLHSLWQQLIQRPMMLVGASMGGAAALDFTLTYPTAVAKLVLIDSAGFAQGPAMEKVMFPPLDRWATAFLKNPGVRRRISGQAYCDRALVTPDAECCAALHTDCPRWSEALIAFTKSGGYNFWGTAFRQTLGQISVPSAILWGKQDRILGIKDAERFLAALPQGRLIWIDQCGHVPHLEKPVETADAIRQFDLATS